MKIKNFKKIFIQILTLVLVVNNLLYFQTPYFAQEATDSAEIISTESASILEPTIISTPMISSVPVTPTETPLMTENPTSRSTVEALEKFIQESSSSAEIIIDHQIKLPFNGSHSISLNFAGTPDDLNLQKEYESFGIVAHNGIDYDMPDNTEILATDRGIVLSAGAGMYGETIVIFHRWGLSYYGHLSKVAVVPGQIVEAGEIIGYSGHSGLATGPHLHFSIKPKNPNLKNGYHGMIDPTIYLYTKPQNNILGKLTSSLRSFKSDEMAEFEIKIKDVNLQYKLKDFAGKRINFKKKTFKVANKNRLSMSRPKNLRPGKYILEVVNDLGEQETQEFYWGVLVINTNKSIYLPGEIGYFQMAALKDDGHTLCKANLKLEITTPDNITFTPEIKNGEECGGDNVTDKPDYFTYQKLDAIGTYKMSLTNLDNNFQIDDQFEVRETLPFEVERVGATRINPFKSSYTMTIKIKANEDFSGEIKEIVPDDFKIINSSISWNTTLSKGEEKTLTYTYQAPKISPEIFLLGPLTIGSFQEARQWQLASDATFQMQTGYYVGDGADNRAITGVGFQPQLLLIKDDTGNGTDGAIWKSSVMSSEVSAKLGDPEADLTTDAIQSLDSNGFTLGTDDDVNGANIRYTWVAFRGSDCTSTGTFCVNSYTGDGNTSHAITSVGFQPDFVTVKRSGTSQGVFRTSSMGTNVAQVFDNTNESTDGSRFKTLDSTGFTVGGNALVNTLDNTYWYFAFKTASNAFAVGTYAGDGLDNKTITTVGFKPNYLWIKNSNATTPVRAAFNLTESNSDYSGAFTDANSSIDLIQSLDSGGFTVGTDAAVNENLKTMYWVAFGGSSNPTATGSYTMKVGTYTGNGTTQSISGVGFAPDVVIIRDDSGSNCAAAVCYGVFRTRLMKGDTTAYLSNPVANFSGAITSLDSDGFSVGANAAVNTNAIVYHYQAFGNAFSPETNTGASDFTIGAHTGSDGDNRNILRVPFQPDFIAMKHAGGSSGVWRTSAQIGDLTTLFGAIAEGADYIQALNSDGFQVGTNVRANQAGNLIHWFAFKASPTMVVNNYTGTASTQNITTVGFNPNLVWIRNTGAVNAVFRSSTIAGDSTLYFANTVAAADRITGFLSNGFTVGGNRTETNTAATTYRYAAWLIPPTLNQIMRHGNWFGGEAEQSFTF